MILQKIIMTNTIIEITKSNFKDYTKLDIIAFSSAAPFAMGDGGGLVIVTKEGKVYHANPYRGDVTMDDAFLFCPPLEKCRFGAVGGGQIPEGWETIYLGFGNHLVINESISALFHCEIEREKIYEWDELYNRWIDIVLKIVGK